MQEDRSLFTADSADPTTAGLPERRRPRPVALCWPCLFPLRRALSRAHLPTNKRIPRMSSARVPGLRPVHLPKDHFAKGIPAKAVKTISGPVGTHPNLPLCPLPDRLSLADQCVQERSQQGTLMQPVDRTLVRAQEGNYHVTKGRRGCMPQRVERVVLDVPMGWQAHRGPAEDGGGTSLAITCETDGRLDPASSAPFGPMSAGCDHRTAWPREVSAATRARPWRTSVE